MQLIEDYKIFKQQKEWQNKRRWTLKKQCEMCLEDTGDLDIYHTYYYPGKLPWEYPDKSLITLCKECEQNRKPIPFKEIKKKEPKKYLNVLEEFRLTQIEEWLNRKLEEGEY